MGIRIGEPKLLYVSDNKLIAGVRLGRYPNARTSLAELDIQTGKLTEFLSFPSGGDTGYPGLVLDNDTLWVSYYSSHEEKTAIYLANSPCNF